MGLKELALETLGASGVSNRVAKIAGPSETWVDDSGQRNA